MGMAVAMGKKTTPVGDVARLAQGVLRGVAAGLQLPIWPCAAGQASLQPGEVGRLPTNKSMTML